MLENGSTIEYARITVDTSFDVASKWCDSLHGSLPVPTSQEENDFLAELGSTFLGVKTTGLAPFTNWNEDHSEPSADGHIVELIVGQKWDTDWDNGLWNSGPKHDHAFPVTCYLQTAIPGISIYQFKSGNEG